MKIKQIIYKNREFLMDIDTYNSLNSKGFGDKILNKFILNEYEVLYLLEKNKIEVIDNKNKKIEFDEIIKKNKIKIFEYLVFKDLTTKGYLIKSGSKYGFTFRAYEKGNIEEHSPWLIMPVKETTKTNILDIIAKNRVSHSTHKSFIIAIIDKDFKITYYSIGWQKF